MEAKEGRDHPCGDDKLLALARSMLVLASIMQLHSMPRHSVTETNVWFALICCLQQAYLPLKFLIYLFLYLWYLISCSHFYGSGCHHAKCCLGREQKAQENTIQLSSRDKRSLGQQRWDYRKISTQVERMSRHPGLPSFPWELLRGVWGEDCSCTLVHWVWEASGCKALHGCLEVEQPVNEGCYKWPTDSNNLSKIRVCHFCWTDSHLSLLLNWESVQQKYHSEPIIFSLFFFKLFKYFLREMQTTHSIFEPKESRLAFWVHFHRPFKSS